MVCRAFGHYRVTFCDRASLTRRAWMRGRIRVSHSPPRAAGAGSVTGLPFTARRDRAMSFSMADSLSGNTGRRPPQSFKSWILGLFRTWYSSPVDQCLRRTSCTSGANAFQVFRKTRTNRSACRTQGGANRCRRRGRSEYHSATCGVCSSSEQNGFCAAIPEWRQDDYIARPAGRKTTVSGPASRARFPRWKFPAYGPSAKWGFWASTLSAL